MIKTFLKLLLIKEVFVELLFDSYNQVQFTNCHTFMSLVC